MKIINLSEGNSLLNQYVAELRDVHVQKIVCVSAEILKE